MQKLIPTISLIIGCISIFGCGNSPTNTANTAPESSTNTVAQSQPTTSQEAETSTKTESIQKPETETSAKTARNTQSETKVTKQPEVGTVKELVNGDLLCYVTLVDENGTKYNEGASFEICAEEAKFLNKKVRASYTIESVSDCQSIEPCGKSRKESIITKMELLDEKSSTTTEDSKSSKSNTISNGEWTITIGNTDSWTGVNNTGNLTYKGCDTQGKCINLTGGKISCRDGKCVTGWTNGDYLYILEQPITEDGNSPSTLIVKKGDSEILKATGLK
ncbi:hypothetical protein [Trichormus variabilis]|uniref:Lipoprotein n=1 Tax=Trichormus variabilis SAG 1403-4b TaxID=447716 RepID=A0A433UI91_ANAVA|nr:hypothetical protein [Trichormus variabilis]MBD2629370.1 hypothetical protein [Trichormus variabilis FACHB-164]RUS93529.1 hypothetical protein DSM107003_43250 [Trichormus variabilis SAG 1403-4b]